MTPEQLEFSLSQYLDGSLPADQIPALEARLRNDAAARELLAEYRTLDTLLKAPAALPAIAWDALASHLSEAVSGIADDSDAARKRDRLNNESSVAEQLEFAVSQYIDGNLPGEQVEAFEVRLQQDSAARESLQDHRDLNALLKSPLGLPAIRWDTLASHLSAVVAESAEPRTLKLFPNRWMSGITRLAIAACLLLAGGLGIRGYLSHRAGSTNSGDPAAVAINIVKDPIVIQIDGPDNETSQGIAVAQVSIGAGSDAINDDSPAFADGIVGRSPRSLIATNAELAQDTNLTPY